MMTCHQEFEAMIKRWLSLIAPVAVMAMCIACVKTETPAGTDKNPDKTPDEEEEPPVEVKLQLGQMELAPEISIEDYVEVTKTQLVLNDGAEIAFALDGSSKPAGKLKYNASTGKWDKAELNGEVPVRAEGGKVCAIHSSSLAINTGTDGAECKGNIVYTDAGTYSVEDDVLTLRLNLDTYAESRFVIEGLSAKAKVIGLKNKTLSSFDGMIFVEVEGTGEGSFDADAGKLTVEGCLPVEADGKTVIQLIYLEGENEGRIFTREYENFGLAGESVTISGPETEDQKDKWTDAGRMPVAVKFRIPDSEDFYEDGQEVILSYDRFQVKVAEIVVLPEDASDKTVSVESSNQSAGGQATDGFVYAWGTGKTTITVTTVNGISSQLTLDVLDKNITVGGFCYEVLKGGELMLRANADSPYSGDVVIPDTAEYGGHQLPVTGIAGSAFYNVPVTSITFGRNIHFLKENAIGYCLELQKVKINRDFNSIDRTNRNFSQCDNLSSIEIEEGNEYLLLEDGVLYCRDDLSQDPHNRCAYVLPTYTDPVVISSQTVEIDYGSIYNAQTTSVTIPRSVKDMGRSLFGGPKTKIESVKLEWQWSEWYSMKFDGIFRSAIFHLENEFFNSHPAKSTVKIYVPESQVLSYRQTGCTWLLAIGNDPSRIVGYSL